MNKKIIILIIVGTLLLVIVAAVGIYFYARVNPEQKAVETENAEKNKIIENSTSGTLPSIENTNPLENKPDLNPVSKTNPYKNIKTNPFE